MINFEGQEATIRFRIYLHDGMSWDEAQKILDMAIRKNPPSSYDMDTTETIVPFESHPRYHIIAKCHPANIEVIKHHIEETSKIFDGLCRDYLKVKEFQAILSTVPIAPIESQKEGAEA